MLFWSFFVHLSWSLLSVAVNSPYFFQVVFIVKEEMERLDSRRVTRHDVNQCLSAVSVQKKCLHNRGFYSTADSSSQKNPLAPR